MPSNYKNFVQTKRVIQKTRIDKLYKILFKIKIKTFCIFVPHFILNINMINSKIFHQQEITKSNKKNP